MHPKTHWAEIEIRSARFSPSVFKSPYLFSNRCLTVDGQAHCIFDQRAPISRLFFPLERRNAIPTHRFSVFSCPLFVRSFSLGSVFVDFFSLHSFRKVPWNFRFHVSCQKNEQSIQSICCYELVCSCFFAKRSDSPIFPFR